MAWVWDGVLDTGTPLIHSRIFVNGAFVTQNSNSVGSGTRGSTATFPLKIGTNGGGGTNTTDLSIDHIMVDRRAYSDGEILELYHNPFKAFGTSGSQVNLPGPPPQRPRRIGAPFWHSIAVPEDEPDWLPRKASAIAAAPAPPAGALPYLRDGAAGLARDSADEEEWLPRRRRFSPIAAPGTTFPFVRHRWVWEDGEEEWRPTSRRFAPSSPAAGRGRRQHPWWHSELNCDEWLPQQRRLSPSPSALVLQIGRITTLPETADTFLMAGWISDLSIGESFTLLSNMGFGGVTVSVSSVTPRFSAWVISARDMSGAAIFNATFSVPVDLTVGWHTYAISVRISSNTLQLLGDQRLFTPSVAFASANPVAYFPTSDPWQIGPVMGQGGGVEIANLRFHAGEPFFDLSSQANGNRLFGPRNQPISWGADGSRVTGIRPAVFLTGDAAGFPHNAGSGGAWAINGGVLTDAPGPL
jgi:hypothetical protein